MTVRTVNGAVLLVRPKEPFLEWAANVDDDAAELAETLRGKTSVYLVDQDPAQEQESAPIELYFERIFELELQGWHLEENDWPNRRDLPTFHEWFDVEASSMVVDLHRGPDAILAEEY